VSNALGEAVIADFDGTLVQLPISWSALRESLSVARIEELWHDADMRRWETVTRAEVDAARTAPAVPFVMEALDSVPALAVLTNNDESAVETFLERWPELRARVRAVVGRRALGGPKTDFEVFSSGYASCLRSLEVEGTAVAYVGDMSYELDYARRLGANVFDVNDLKAASQRPGKG
jgi:phosphoglycolate phosphatase-like HAD superfamily hydrolase